MAGGGPAGAVYEIGALYALEEAVEGLPINDLDIYVGVSAGAFIGASLVNGLTPTQMVRAIVKQGPGEHPFVPETFLTPSFREVGKRLASIPGLLAQAIAGYARHPQDALLGQTLAKLGQALPVGLFDNEPIRHYLEKIYNLKGRTDDFRKLRRPLVVVAADLDAGTAVRFGSEGWDHVPISRAVQASTALPGLYSPVEIEGRSYVDGALLRTLHASVALEAGVELLICLNPIVPIDTTGAIEAGQLTTGKLVERGLPAVLSQSLRTLIRSRLDVGLSSYRRRFNADIVLFEPLRRDYKMFFTNIFGFSDRQVVCEHAYQATRKDLLSRYQELAPAFARHGLKLRRDVLEDPSRDLWVGVGLPHLSRRRHSTLDVVTRLDRALARLEEWVDDPSEDEAEGEPSRPSLRLVKG